MKLDGNTFLIFSKIYNQARITMWGTGGRDMGTYDKDIYSDQFWQLKSDENHPGYFYIKNVRHSGYRIAKWGKEGSKVGCYNGDYYDDQLWNFENVDGKYFILNF